MADLQVTCVKTLYPGTENRHIYWLGGPQFSKGVSEVIADIKYGWHTYYTLVFGRRANLEVGSDGYTEWVQTVPDYFTPNNLYSLPSCP